MIDKYIYVNRCVFCGKIISEHKLFCEDCKGKAHAIVKEPCQYCGREKEFCNCKIGDFAFDRNISYFYYDDVVSKIIYRFKFHDKLSLGSTISKYMLTAISDKYNNFTFDFVTYVPMFLLKRLYKGYNPAFVLAEYISKSMNLPLKSALGCKFRTKSQKSVPYKDRRKNVKGKFYVKHCDVKDKSILLIDDVMTSGSTLSECARMLKKAGAKQVLCATFAITLKK